MHVASASARVDQDVTYWVKGTKLRIEAAAAPGQARPKYRAIVDSFGGHPMLINIADDMHAFTVVDLGADAGRPETWEHRKLGTIGRVADRDCVEWEAHAPGRTVVACMAEERLFDLAGLGAAAPVPMPWLGGMDGFPMRSVEKDDAGRELSRTEVTRVTRGTVAAEELEVPKTYSRIEGDTPNVTTGRMRK